MPRWMIATVAPILAAVTAHCCRTAGPSLDAAPPQPPVAAPATNAGAVGAVPYDGKLVAEVLADARSKGDARRGAAVFGSHATSCLVCHHISGQGGRIGPDLSTVGKTLPPAEIVEGVIWPRRKVKPEFVSHIVRTDEGVLIQGFKVEETEKLLALRDPTTDKVHRIAKDSIDDRREIGTPMPDGLWSALSAEQRRDLIRFLLELGHTEGIAQFAHRHDPAPFDAPRAPLSPDDHPNHGHAVNRGRIYDWYAKQAEHFRTSADKPFLLPGFPGLDGGKLGHWGNQKEADWANGRWNRADLGTVMCGVFRGAGVTVPRGVCVRLGDDGSMAACFNPDTLTFDAVWKGGFVRFSEVRSGFMGGVLMDGTALPRPEGARPDKPFRYHGFHRHGKRVIFAYRIGDVEMLDSAWVEDGKFVRHVGPAAGHPLADLIKGGPPQWDKVFETRGTPGKGRPYAVDTIVPPSENPWGALFHFGGHDFLPDGTAFLCTMEGDVWRVQGLDDKLERVRWRRFASGLHHAQGLVVAEGSVYVLGRDQITRLVDRNNDGEADFHECFSNAWVTSTAGHDFICGLERDAQGRFYTASGNQGLLRIAADGRTVEVLATGFRNPDGLGLRPDGTITVPVSEGEWTPASMIHSVRPTGGEPSFHGYGGPRAGKVPALPLVYLPRGLDNSAGGQTYVDSDRWGPLKGLMVHTSYGAGTHFLLLHDELGDGNVQGAVVPLAGEFLSGAHRGRFNPRDGQFYVTGMSGWGTYTVSDGCFHRVRYTGDPVQLPVGIRTYRNGVLVRFSGKVDAEVAGRTSSHYAQCWNYRYGPGYGSPEFSARHFGARGHDPLVISSAHVLPDGKGLFLELPDLQPVNQLHLSIRTGPGRAHEIFATVHQSGDPFTELPGYRPVDKTVAAHPILADIALAARRVPNPYKAPLPGARLIVVEAGKNLTFATRTITVKAGEPLRVSFRNPDVVPHNWVLVKPGSLERVGDLANKLVADPDAAARQFVPASPDVVAWTDVVGGGENSSINFKAPAEKGRYPFLCTFPGHWMVMNGLMIVE